MGAWGTTPFDNANFLNLFGDVRQKVVKQLLKVPIENQLDAWGYLGGVLWGLQVGLITPDLHADSMTLIIRASSIADQLHQGWWGHAPRGATPARPQHLAYGNQIRKVADYLRGIEMGERPVGACSLSKLREFIEKA